MLNRTGLLHRQQTYRSEATSIFDSADRWTIAEHFGINRIHELSRVKIYNAVAADRSCSHFQDVMGELAGCRRDEENDKQSTVSGLQDQVYVNWAEFTNDLQAPPKTDYGSLQPLAETHRWLRDVIAKHCPFVQPSLNNGRIWLTVARASETGGSEIANLLRRTRDLFKLLSPAEDRSKLLNAMVLVMPEMPHKPRRISAREYLGEHRQDFGEECGADITIGSFAPSEPVSAIADPLRIAPPMFVFRHTMPRGARRLPEHEEDGSRPF